MGLWRTGGAARPIGCEKRGGARNQSHWPGGGAGGNLEEDGDDDAGTETR